MSTQSWSIIVFCYNEEGSIERVLRNALQFLQKIQATNSEILVIEDGSADRSFQIASRLAAQESSIRIIRHERNLGIGRTLLDGYAAARCENVVAIPADGQFDLEECIPFANIEPSRFVSFYRKAQSGYSLSRILISRLNLFFNRALGLRLLDVNWVKIYKRHQLHALGPLVLESSLVESEICAKLAILGFKAIETPSVYHPRLAGVSSAAAWIRLKKVIAEMPKLTMAVYSYRAKQLFSGPKSLINDRNDREP